MSLYEQNTMSVQHEIRSQLAKLLATENLVVEHKNVETACFNVHTRVMTLPMGEKSSNEVYDMLSAHEVGHALYTPDRDWLKEYKIPPQFVNVVEDARIEKLMKRRYPGIPKTFYRGYSELSEQDFFLIEGEDISKMNLADRANLYFKIGNFVQIPFDEELEMPIIRMIGGCEDFDDVLLAAQELYKYCKSQMDTDTKTDMDSLESQGQSSTEQVTEQVTEQEQPGEGEETLEQPSGSKDEQLEESESQGSEISQEPSVDTMNSLEKSIQDLVNNEGRENVYLELPKVDLNNIIIPNEKIHYICDYQWKESPIEWFDQVDSEFLKFKKSAQKEVNYLVKEFECRKSADSYARATTARTGVLDCTKLHTYKYNEDLFKKVTTLADGKNHGLVFVLDWSASMSKVMLDTVKQLFNLVWFCKKVGIPFEVYAFTYDYPLYSMDENGQETLRELCCCEIRNGLIQISERFSLMNILTHKTNTKTLEHQLKNIFRLAWCFSKYVMYHIPVGMGLSGTPLNETIIALHQIIPQFKKENKLQKVQCVVLTDGEGYPMKYHREVQRHWEDEPYMGLSSVGYGCFLRDRNTGNTYNMSVDWYQMTDILIQNLRDNFTDTNFIGIRVLESREANSFIRRYTTNRGEFKFFEYEKIQAQWKKERAFAIKNSGYHTYFGLSASALANESEFEVGEDATKTQIKSALVKSLRNKKMNKKVLNEFVELIA